MYVYWKPLLFLGFLFWIIMFSTDVLQHQIFFESFISEPPSAIPAARNSLEVEKKASTEIVVEPSQSEEKLNPTFGLTMLFANIFIFVFSLVFCSLAKFLASVICKGVKRSDNKPVQNSNSPDASLISNPNKDQKNELITVTASESAICEKKALTSEISCPDLTTKQRYQSHQTCQTIFHTPLFAKQDQALRAECVKLREELLSLHTNSIKEHALLSRKLESMAKDKRELSKRLNAVQKENQVAKIQIDEMMNDKKLMQKRLENATKEFRVNTKNKKVALAKLEEISSTVDDLKRQLEQVTRDKEILQGKLEVLRNEYEQIQERMRMMQLKESSRMSEERTVAERDENVIEKRGEMLNEEPCTSSQSSLNQNLSKESVFLPFVLSQTEVDMKNIQMKILQLENSLKEINSKSDIRHEMRIDMKAEPDLETTTNESSEIAEKLDSSRYHPISPRTITPRSDVTCRKAYDEIKVQMLRSALREKIKVLENMKERGDESTTTGGISDQTTDEFEMSSEENISSPRIVSNSVAFQRFLKNIGAEPKSIPIGDSKFNG